MQQTVEDIQQHLGDGIVAVLTSDSGRCLHAQHNLARQGFTWRMERKCDNIGGFIVVQEAVVDGMDGGVVQEDQANLGLRYALRSQDGPAKGPAPRRGNANRAVQGGDADANHDVSDSEKSTALGVH
jgi:hypothetical protein